MSKEWFAVSPYDEFRTNEAKAWRDSQINAGKTVLKKAEVKPLQAMVDALLAEPAIAAGLFDERGELETSVIHKDEETGLWLKCRPDVVPINSMLVDLKTTADARRRAIEYAIIDYGYHQQLALAAEVIEKVIGVQIETAALVFIEKEPPYTVTIAELDLDYLGWGKILNRAAMRKFADCLAKGPDMKHFPSDYNYGELLLRAPEWYVAQLMKRQEADELPTFFDVGVGIAG